MVTTNSVANRPLISPASTDASIAGPSEKLSAKKHVDAPAQRTAADTAPSLVSGSNGLAAKLAANTEAYSLAEQVRSTDTTMEEIGRTIGKMKKALEGIVKNYPPYPPGSIERAEKLKSFNGLRSLIDRLTFPPEPSAFGEAQPGASGKHYPTVAIENQQVGSGPEGLNIPALPAEASDDEIHDALAKLDAADEKLAGRRDALSEEAVAIAGEIYPAPLAGNEERPSLAGEQGVAGEDEAEHKSYELKKIFSTIGYVGASRERSQLMELLK